MRARERSWAGNNPPSKDTQATEIKVSFSKLGVKPEAGHQLGLAFALTNATGDATQKWFFWPRSAEVQAPNTWGQAVLQ